MARREYTICGLYGRPLCPLIIWPKLQVFDLICQRIKDHHFFPWSWYKLELVVTATDSTLCNDARAIPPEHRFGVKGDIVPQALVSGSLSTRLTRRQSAVCYKVPPLLQVHLI